MKTCVFVGCQKPLYALAFCNGHYKQSRAGRGMRPLARRPSGDLVAWFWTQVRKTPGCWNWTGTDAGYGYGYVNMLGEKKAHRVSWVIAKGPIPRRMFVLHRCDNPGCVRPSHLWLGTQRDNMEDMDAKGRRPRGELHGTSKLTESMVREVRRLCAAGMAQGELGKRLGVSQSTIGRAVRGVCWRHVR